MDNIVIYYKAKGNRSDGYICRIDDFQASYSTRIYGKYARAMAELSEETGIKYKNVILVKKKYGILKIFSKKFGECDIKFDLEDLDYVMSKRWYVSGIIPYVLTKIDGKRYYMHKLLMNAGKGVLVDHRDRDTFNNQKSNLKISNHKENNRNRSLPSTNKTGYMGVTLFENSYVATWVDEDGRQHSRWFSINTYGEEEALKKAIKCRVKNTEHYNRFKKIKIKRV